MSILNKVLTLSLNSNWQPIGHKNVQDAISEICTPSFKALDINYKQNKDGSWDYDEIESMAPVDWDEWIELPIRDFDFSIKSARLKVRIPTVIIAVNFNKMPKSKPKLTKRNIRARDKGICQYTGKKLKPSQGNVDHVIPVSRGGANTWQNMVYCCKELNVKKGNKLPEEFGLNLIQTPREPQPSSNRDIIKKINHRDWSIFI